MKIFSTIALFATLLMAGCSSSNSANDPQKVAEEFVQAMFTADYTAAQALCSQEGKEQVGTIAEALKSKKDIIAKANPKTKVQIVNTAENNETSVVEIIVTDTANLSTGEVNQEELFCTVHLIKEDGKWVVNMF